MQDSYITANKGSRSFYPISKHKTKVGVTALSLVNITIFIYLSYYAIMTQSKKKCISSIKEAMREEKHVCVCMCGRDKNKREHMGVLGND